MPVAFLTDELPARYVRRMITTILALALQCIGPGPDAPQIAAAVVQAVEWRAARGLPPITESPAGDVCLVGRFIAHESGAALSPRPWSWDSRGGVSCGALQMRCARIAGHSVFWQVAAWLSDASKGLPGMCGYGAAAQRMAAARRNEALEAVRAAL
jgi:hypothetical protein